MRLPIALIASGLLGGLLLMFGGGSDGDTAPDGTPDAVDVAFDEYKKLWRATQVRCAEKLESKEFTTSQQVTEFRSRADGEAIKASRQPLLDAEFADHGGKNWTAEKAAKYLRGYGR